jgi:hypothetical protein
MLVGHSVAEKRLFSSVVTDLGAAAIENVGELVARLRRHALNAIVIGEAIDDYSALRFVRAARRLDPDILVLVERPLFADTLRRTLTDVLRFQSHVRI